MLKKSKEEIRQLMGLRSSSAAGAFKSKKAYRRKERSAKTERRSAGWNRE